MPREDTQFKPGQSGNRKGRPKGSRNKLTKAYLRALKADFLPNQKEVFENLRKDHLPIYGRMIGALVPKDVDVNHSGGVSVRVVKYSDDENSD